MIAVEARTQTVPDGSELGEAAPPAHPRLDLAEPFLTGHLLHPRHRD
jgi:hypothetical protein